MLGTPARLLTAMRTIETRMPCLAYSRRYRAASTPRGTTMIDMIRVMITVPKMAGQTPPSLFAERGSSSRNSSQRSL